MEVMVLEWRRAEPDCEWAASSSSVLDSGRTGGGGDHMGRKGRKGLYTVMCLL